MELSYLTPETPLESSRLSSPRSSLGEGISTDCEADVESNLSAVSSDNSPSLRRKQSSAYYGLVCKKNCFSANDGDEKSSKSNVWKTSGWKIISSCRKVLFMIFVLVAFLLIVGFLFFIPTSESECESTKPLNRSDKNLSSWPLRFTNWEAYTPMLLVEVSQNGKKAIVFALKKRGEELRATDKISEANSSVILIIDPHSGQVIKMTYLPFTPDWLLCLKSVSNTGNISCHASDSFGHIAKLDLNKQVIIWNIKPCRVIFSFITIPDIDNDSVDDLMAVCAWKSSNDQQLSGIILISGEDGYVIGSKVRYEVNRRPSSFLMKQTGVRNETFILFGTKQKSLGYIVWAVRLKRVIQISTGYKEGAHLVSENPLKIVSGVRADIDPIRIDINGDGKEDIGLALISHSIAFVDGSSLSLLKIVNTGLGSIIR